MLEDAAILRRRAPALAFWDLLVAFYTAWPSSTIHVMSPSTESTRVQRQQLLGLLNEPGVVGVGEASD